MAVRLNTGSQSPYTTNLKMACSVIAPPSHRSEPPIASTRCSGASNKTELKL